MIYQQLFLETALNDRINIKTYLFIVKFVLAFSCTDAQLHGIGAHSRAQYMGLGHFMWEQGTLCGSRALYMGTGNITSEQGTLHGSRAHYMGSWHAAGHITWDQGT